ncbi:MAG: glycosyltransferase family 2 protein [Patescibacteria group bacterium]
MGYKIDSLSLFFPAYNEEANAEKTILKAKKVLEKNVKNWEILVINDGSSDRTKEIVEDLIKDKQSLLLGRVRVISHDKNRGYGAAFKSGLYNAKYDWITFTDIDGQFDFSEITNFFDKQEETNADLVIGYYKKRRVSKFKIVTSRMWELVVFLLFGLHVKDIDCGFKLISKKVVDKIPKLESERGAFISSEFLIKSRKAGFKIVEIPVTHYPRVAGKGTGRDLMVIVKSFVDLFRLWRKLR